LEQPLRLFHRCDKKPLVRARPYSRRTSDFCSRNCPDFWRMCLWINEVVCISNTTELLLILHAKSEICWTIVPLGDGSDVGSPQLVSQVSRLKPTGLFCVWGWMK